MRPPRITIIWFHFKKIPETYTVALDYKKDEKRETLAAYEPFLLKFGNVVCQSKPSGSF